MGIGMDLRDSSFLSRKKFRWIFETKDIDHNVILSPNFIKLQNRPLMSGGGYLLIEYLTEIPPINHSMPHLGILSLLDGCGNVVEKWELNDINIEEDSLYDDKFHFVVNYGKVKYYSYDMSQKKVVPVNQDIKLTFTPDEEIKVLKDKIAQLESEKMKYSPTLGELLDRLTITQLKEVKIPEHKDKYSQEISEIVHDINLLLKKNNIVFTAEMLRDLIILAQYNNHIWVNESNFRKGIKDGNNLELSHSLNGIRATAKNRIQSCIGGRQDYKVDNVEAFAQWIPSGY